MAIDSPPLSSAKVLIIGGGMGGLATALALARRGFTNITVFEMASKLTEIGAGINITPNLARLLDRFGVLNVLQEEAVVIRSANILKGTNDEALSFVKYSYMEKDFGYPFFVAHRTSLQRALIVGCQQSGVVDIKLGVSVTGIDLENARVQICPTAEREVSTTTEWIQGDVIIAADGVKSATRALMLARSGIKDEVEDTRQASYRILVRREQVLDKPELLELLDGNQTYRWIGPRRLIMSYPILKHTLFNIVSAHPDSNFAEAPSTSWTTRGSKQRMLEVFSDFCPRVQSLLKLVPDGEVCEWKLRVHAPLPTWVDGRTALLGDACHPTLPHIAQGAAQAVEDAAVVAIALSKITTEKDIHKALRIYQLLRKERAEFCVKEADANGREMLLSDEEVAERDKRFREASKDGGANPDKFVDKNTQNILFNHDCEKIAFERWDELWESEELST
ncbi:hypothetical protein M422DRAFT_783207 [Sphaerobolus stellatus SS14]|uniref:FAD-binding domain-containing protein n=1 Tax=Sphaerobolus stellatus (strain SS14) TaxID=990650 RepID=A0A0C9UV94_SPHS4|nr:hypothetical protein M422DRAFT_783207 [Sphaerobolus stellatus SS14]